MSGEREIPNNNQNLYQSIIEQKAQEGVNAQIDQIIVGQMTELRKSGAISVVYEPWNEIYFKVEGGWKGSGGFFGSLTLLAKELDEQLSKEQADNSQSK